MYPFKPNDMFVEMYHRLEEIIQIRQTLGLTSSSEIIRNTQNKMEYVPDYIKYRLKWSDRAKCIFCVELFTWNHQNSALFSHPAYVTLILFHMILCNWWYNMNKSKCLILQTATWGPMSNLRQNYLKPIGQILFFLLAWLYSCICFKMKCASWNECFVSWVVYE